jgi:Cdc6-like AAA superfamily ATPase
MKFHETHFEDYILSNQRENLHPKLSKVFSNFPKQIHDLKNVIFYGPNGIGKYTQMLKLIKKYSQSDLKYEKKISIPFNKQSYFFKISDIHYEVDMSLLGCNSKLLWHEIYMQLIDIISSKTDKSGIIVCKYFHEINSELLDNFYSYMQVNNNCSINLKYFIITEEISFIPDNILNCCQLINIPRPTKTLYNKCFHNKLKVVETITNIKNLYNYTEELNEPYKIICNKIIHVMIRVDELKYLKFRDLLYDIFIYNLDITDCFWYIFSQLIEQKLLNSDELKLIMIKTFTFFQYYNNNYRPIYHLENFLLYVVSVIHRFNVENT